MAACFEENSQSPENLLHEVALFVGQIVCWIQRWHNRCAGGLQRFQCAASPAFNAPLLHEITVPAPSHPNPRNSKRSAVDFFQSLLASFRSESVASCASDSDPSVMEPAWRPGTRSQSFASCVASSDRPRRASRKRTNHSIVSSARGIASEPRRLSGTQLSKSSPKTKARRFLAGPEDEQGKEEGQRFRV
jgi:hypothetical protein